MKKIILKELHEQLSEATKIFLSKRKRINGSYCMGNLNDLAEYQDTCERINNKIFELN